ncbi:MAG: hypothetical protein HYZ28_24160 [Myxococcales bacterium]|nr:hypothetical protein [Myxococcales bacterium]
MGRALGLAPRVSPLDRLDFRRRLRVLQQAVADLRSIVAHFYPVIDFDKVHASLREVDDLDTFAQWAEARLRD